jgi:hypothetical protein
MRLRDPPCSRLDPTGRAAPVSRPNQTSVRNQLLSPDDYAILQPHLEAVTLDKGLVLVEPIQPIPCAVFPGSGLGSVVAISPDAHKSEVGIFGRDGLACTALLPGTDRTPQQVRVRSTKMVRPGSIRARPSPTLWEPAMSILCRRPAKRPVR